MVFINLLIFAVGIFGLVKSSQFAVRSITKISESLRIRAFIISFIIVGFISTFPELFVGVISAFQGSSSLGLGSSSGSPQCW